MCETAEVDTGTVRGHERKWLTLEGVIKNEPQEFTEVNEAGEGLPGRERKDLQRYGHKTIKQT